jgi:hypothetical protein
MCTDIARIDLKEAVDFTGKSELEICYPQHPIIYLSWTIEGCSCRHNDCDISQDVVLVAVLSIWCGL